MTERFEIASLLQRELARMPEVFGTLEKGSPDHPAVVMENVHYFLKEVAGKPLTRPAWFFDVTQQGEGIPDVGTHLVDLIQWQCFPDQAIDWKKDIKVLRANRSPTTLTPEQFQRVTGLDRFPAYLKNDVGPSGHLNVFANGDVLYTLRGVHAKVTASWKFAAAPGAKDTHYALVRGSRAHLEIKQGADQNYVPTLFVLNPTGIAPEEFERPLRAAVLKLSASWPGLVDVQAKGNAWQILIPDKYHVGHEAHFAQVTEKYLRFLAEGKMPAWEVPNMIAKYYTTTEAYRLSHAR
jgi:predicted dehydrogenase